MKKPRTKPSLRWQPDMEEKLLGTLLQAQVKGLQTDNAGFKKAGWDLALQAVQTVTNQPVSLQQIKSKYDNYKQDWKVWKHFVEQSGHGWDEEKGVPTAEPEVLEAYFEAHPKARKFRDKPIPYAEKLQALLDGALATGEHVASVDDLLNPETREEDDNDEEEDRQSEHSDSETPYDSIELSDSRSSTPSRSPSILSTSSHSPTPNQTNRKSTLSLRKRTLKNAAEAELRKRRKSSGHALADALENATGEIRAAREALLDMARTPSAQVAEILVSEFEYLSGEDQDFVYATIESGNKASLFLARSKDERRRWVDRTLREAKGLADDDQSVA